MEPITLCGAVVIAFGLWVELEPKLRTVARVIRKCRLFTGINSQSTAQRPVNLRRMPICVAKTFN